MYCSSFKGSREANPVTILIAWLLLLWGVPSTTGAQTQDTPETGTGNPEAEDEDNKDPASGDGTTKEGDPVDMQSGAFYFSKPVLNIPGRGMDLDFTLKYRSSAWAAKTTVASRWTHGYDQRLVVYYKRIPRPPPTPPGDARPPVARTQQGVVSPPPSVQLPTIQLDVYYYHDLQIDHFIATSNSPNSGWTLVSGGFLKLQSENEHMGPYWIPRSFTIRDRNGTKITFPATLSEGDCDVFTFRPSQIEDRNGNALTFGYENKTRPGGCPLKLPTIYRRLTTVTDTYGRAVSLAYNETSGWLETISDFDGRIVSLEHDERGNLRAITTPEVTVFPPGVAGVPYSSRTEFTYSARNPLYPKSGHNIVNVYAPVEVALGLGNPTAKIPYVQNIWDESIVGNQVVRQILGGTNHSGVAAGGTYTFLYEPLDPYEDHGWFQAGSRTLAIDPNGYARLYIFDNGGQERLVSRFTGGIDHATINLSDPPGIGELVEYSPTAELTTYRLNPSASFAPIGSQVDAATCTFERKSYGKHNLIIAQETPHDRFAFVYDADSPDLFQQANLLISKQVSRTNPNDVIVRAMMYEPLYNQPRLEFDPRAFGGYSPPNGGSASADRYSTKRYFDYQKGSVSAVEDETSWGIDLEQQSAIDSLEDALQLDVDSLQFGLTQLPGDGASRGNQVLTAQQVNVFDDPVAASFTTMTVQTTAEYNEFGLPTVITDAAGYETSYAYYPISAIAPEPDVLTPSATDGGYLATITSQLSLTSSGSTTVKYGYNSLGRQSVQRSGRGFDTVITFDELDRPVIITDAAGCVTGWLYDENNNLEEFCVDYTAPEIDATSGMPSGSQTTPRRIRTSHTYDILGNVIQTDTQVTETLLAETRYRYDRKGMRVLTLYPEWSNDPANVDALVYDEFGQLFTTTAGGITVQFANLPSTADIPERGSIPVEVADQTASTVFRYDLARFVRRIDPEGRMFKKEYDGFGRVNKSVDPIGSYTLYGLDVSGQLETEESNDAGDALLARTHHLHDELGRVFERRGSHFDHAGVNIGDGVSTTRTVFDVRGNAVATVNDLSVGWTREFNGLNQLTREDDSAGNYNLYTYDANGNLIYSEDHTRETDAPSNWHIRKAWMFHDARDRLTAKVDTLGHAHRSFYDSLGRVVFKSDARANQTNVSISTLDDATHPQHASLAGAPTVNSHGNTTLLSYTDAGFQSTTAVHQRVSGVGGNSLLPGGLGQVVATRAYDLNGRLTTQVDDHGKATAYEYDSLNRKVRTVHANGAERTYEYFKDGRLHRSIDSNATTVEYSYDANGRRSREDVTAAAPDLRGAIYSEYGYDGLNRMTLAVNACASVTREYDSLSRVIAEVLNGRRTDIAHNSVGAITAIAYPGGRSISQTYDTIGRLRTIVDSVSGNVDQLEYSTRSAVKSSRLGNGIKTEFEYDAAQRVLELLHAHGSTIVDKQTFAWDRQDNKTERNNIATSPALVHEYTYDSSRRLVESDRTGGGHPSQTIGYQLDDVGNRASVSGGPNGGTYVSDANVHSYTSTPFDSREYDTNGNLVRRTSTETMRYDYRNKLVEYFDSATNRWHFYSYDALGRRVRKISDAGTAGEKEVHYFYDGGWNVCEEATQAGVTLATFVYREGLDRVVSMQRDVDQDTIAEDYYFLADDVGSVVAIADANGQVVERYDYGDYGEPLDPTNSMQPKTASAVASTRLFAGRELDWETGFYYFRHRYFEPVVGRFTTRDPLGIWGDSLNGGNGYTYAACNPWTIIDPLGLSGWDKLWGAVKAVGGTAEAVAGGALAAAAGWTGIGAVAGVAIAAHGADVAQSGVRQAISGKQTDSLTSQGLQAAGVSQNTANLVDAGISVVGSAGAGIATAAIKVANIRAADPLAKGLSSIEILGKVEQGSKALNNADYIALGGEATSALAKAEMIKAGVDAAGNAYTVTSGLGAGVVKGSELFVKGTGFTPGAEAAIGIAGAILAAVTGVKIVTTSE